MLYKSISPTAIEASTQANERVIDSLRREGIGQVASCRFVASPLLDEEYQGYPKSAPKTLLPWYRRYDKGSR